MICAIRGGLLVCISFSSHVVSCRLSTISRNLLEARKEVKGIAKVTDEVISLDSEFIKFYKIIETTTRALSDQ